MSHAPRRGLTDVVLPQLPNGTDNPGNVAYVYSLAGTGNNTGRLISKTDGTGITNYDYGVMGELVSEQRTVIGYNFAPMDFITQFEYDSWNRLQQIIYPDGENVNYTYDLGGNLVHVYGNDNYIDDIQYDLYNQKTEIFYGNGTSENFNYTPALRRLANHTLKENGGQAILDNTYAYDIAGNIVDFVNQAPQSLNQMGGNYTFNYGYDELNRLVTSSGNLNDQSTPLTNYAVTYASFDLAMTYSPTGCILQKDQRHLQDGNDIALNTYNNQYTYLSGTHKLQSITDPLSFQEDFAYDGNGNLTSHTRTNGSNDELYWDEQDRLRAFYNDASDSYQYNVYSDAGERTIKYSLEVPSQLYQNGEVVDPGNFTIKDVKIYPNAYEVVSANGTVSKHYYAGSQRIASRVVVGPPLYRQAARGDSTAEKNQEDFGNYASKAGFETGEVEMSFQNPPRADLYFLHGDHLGTASFVTNSAGHTTQFFLNLPFGETMAEQNEPGDYNNPYKFNGKELDEETGLYYYGARFYDPRVSVWLGVDPLSEKYLDISPYSYVANNPIMFIDPDGREIVIPTSLKGSDRRKIMRQLTKLTNNRLSYDKSTGQVTIREQRKGNKASGTTLISNLISDTKVTTIVVGAKGSGNSATADSRTSTGKVDWTNASNGTGDNATVRFDPTANPEIPTADPKTGNVSGAKRPNKIGLGHELIHADHINNGDVNFTPTTHTYNDVSGTSTTQTVINEELRTVGLQGVKTGDVTENDLRREQRQTRKKQRGAY